MAAVADLLISNILNPSSLILDRETITTACLLHDMGNIVKFDFDYMKENFSTLIDINFLPQWEEVKKEFVLKYGPNSHAATMKIIEELGVSESTRELVDCIGFDKGEANVKSSDFSKKICAYSDMRAEPHGIVSLEERFQGLRHRYQNHREGTDRRDIFEKSLREIEKQIFARCKINPEEVTDEKIGPIMEKLRGFEI